MTRADIFFSISKMSRKEKIEMSAAGAKTNLVCGVQRRRDDGLCFTHDELVCYYAAAVSLVSRKKMDNLTEIMTWSRPQLWRAIWAELHHIERN